MCLFKRMLLVVGLLAMAGAQAGEQPQKSGWFGWVRSFFGSKPVQIEPKRFTYLSKTPQGLVARTPQDVAYEDLVVKYGCNSDDPKALCNIQIPEIELRKVKNAPSDVRGFFEKRGYGKEPVIHSLSVEGERDLRPYLSNLRVPLYWAGSENKNEPSAINDISSMKERPELEDMMAESVPSHYDTLVRGVQENMEQRVVNDALSDVVRNEKSLNKALDMVDDRATYAQEVLHECLVRHPKSSAQCGVQEFYLNDANDQRNTMYQILEPKRQALSNARRKLELRQNDLKEQRFARKRIVRQLEEDQKWRDWLIKQEIGQ